MRRRDFKPELPDLRGVVCWLFDHGVAEEQIADILSFTIANVKGILHRRRKGIIGKLEKELLDELDNRLKGLDRTIYLKATRDLGPKTLPKRIRIRQAQVDSYADNFWQGVPFLAGAAEIGVLLRKISTPDKRNLHLLRIQARLYLLECKIYLHAGYAFTALHYGLQAFGFWEYIYRRSSSAEDLHEVSQAVLHISNAFISRRDVKRARAWLEVARQAFEGSNAQRIRKPDPEYLRQMASVARGVGDIVEARKLLKQARECLPYTVPDATPAALNDMSDRVLNVIADTPQWENSLKLFYEAQKAWPAYDGHRASNLLWTVSCGLQTDSMGVSRAAMDLLADNEFIAGGFGLQSTGAYLLSLTPRIPNRLRRDWAMFAISYNAYSGK